MSFFTGLHHLLVLKKDLIVEELVVTEMSSHFTDPHHLLVLKEDLIVEEGAVCYGCNKSVIGFSTFTCTNPDDNHHCQSFYLHKSCADLPPQITHILMHCQHPLLLQCQPLGTSFCNGCRGECWRLYYRCDHCDFDICLNCASQGEDELTIQHRGHYDDHYLNLIQREVLFHCDACGMEAKEASYKCTTCQFWIHKSCASSPDIILTPYHHHSLHLIFSIPDMHRTFWRFCNICRKFVRKVGWAYYCHKCTYFVHLRCAKSGDTEPMINEIEGDCLDTEPHLLQIPLPNEDSLLDFIIQQVGMFNVKFEGEDTTTTNISTPIPNGPLIHWSHPKHQLELHEYSTISPHILDDDEDGDEEDDNKVLVCDGCIQPITASRPSYYACLQCDFFLHSFCATKLPAELPTGAPQSHPQHALPLSKYTKFYVLDNCRVCDLQTNGFFYKCTEATCDFVIDIICAFLPTRIRHESHKHHPLVQRASSSGELCRVTRQLIRGMEYGCETCNDFEIHMACIFLPSRMKHKYVDHSIVLRNPPFFYEGVIYCEICEEEVNNQEWLYHCGGECDHSFHSYCLRSMGNVKEGGRIAYTDDNQPHTLTLVIKMWTKKTRWYYCSICRGIYDVHYFLECDGCGFLMCGPCAKKIFKPILYTQ